MDIATAAATTRSAAVPIVAFSRMRWESLPARARRKLSNLARTRSVFFLEQPERVETGDREFWELKCGAPDLLVCRPRIATGEREPQAGTCTRMAAALLRWLGIDEFVAWLYSPSELAWAQALSPSLVIHDRSVESEDFQRAFFPVLDEVGDARREGSETPFEVGAGDFLRRELDESSPTDD